jgi:hypothetical protein
MPFCYGCCCASAAAACCSSSYPHSLRCLSGLVISDSHFLRVSFGDEHGDRLFSSRQQPVDEFYRLMGDVLRLGKPDQSGTPVHLQVGICRHPARLHYTNSNNNAATAYSLDHIPSHVSM